MISGTIHVGFLAILLAASVAEDVLRRRVPNAVVLVTLGAGLAARLDVGGLSGAVTGLAGAALALALFLVPWQLRLVGGGDAKLACAAAAWVGIERLVPFLAATALAGGLVSLAALAARAPRPTISAALASALGRCSPTARRGITVPYAPAIAVGAIVAIWWRAG